MTQAQSSQARKSSGGMRRVDLKDAQLGSNDIGRRINRDIVLQLIRTLQPIFSSRSGAILGPSAQHGL